MSDAYDRSAAYYDEIYSEKDYAAEAEVVRSLIADTHPAAQTLLEVGCGTGGHLQFFRASFACEGVDLSPAMLASAQAKLPDVPLHQGDMRTFDLPRRFDVVASLFSGIGYVRSTEELNTTVRRMADHLEPDGLLMVEPWIDPDDWKPGDIVRGGLVVDRDDLKIARMVISATQGRFAVMPMHHTIATLDGIEHFVETHEMFLATRDEYRHAFEAAGLRDVRFVEGLVRGIWLSRR